LRRRSSGSRSKPRIPRFMLKIRSMVMELEKWRWLSCKMVSRIIT
jgi:hypothetical protein